MVRSCFKLYWPFLQKFINRAKLWQLYLLGMMNIAATYSSTPAIKPVTKVNMAQTSRMAVGSTPKYSPIPPQTPPIYLFESDRVNFFSICSPLLYFMISLPWLYFAKIKNRIIGGKHYRMKRYGYPHPARPVLRFQDFPPEG